MKSAPSRYSVQQQSHQKRILFLIPLGTVQTRGVSSSVLKLTRRRDFNQSRHVGTDQLSYKTGSRIDGRGAKRLPTASHGVPRKESATTQPAAVNAKVVTNSPNWKALIEPAERMGTHTSSANMPICNAESVAASRANAPVSTASPAAMKVAPVKYAQNTCHGSQPGTRCDLQKHLEKHAIAARVQRYVRQRRTDKTAVSRLSLRYLTLKAFANSSPGLAFDNPGNRDEFCECRNPDLSGLHHLFADKHNSFRVALILP